MTPEKKEIGLFTSLATLGLIVFWITVFYFYIKHGSRDKRYAFKTALLSMGAILILIVLFGGVFGYCVNNVGV